MTTVSHLKAKTSMRYLRNKKPTMKGP